MRHFNNKEGIHNYEIGSDLWLIKETRGSNIFDKIILDWIKVSYFFYRISLRFFLGRKRRDKFWIKKNISFRDFLYNSVEFLKLDKALLVVFYNPRYDFKFYARITRKVNNFSVGDVYKSMAAHESEIINYFAPSDGDTVVDIGAAFGFYSIIASKKVKSKGIVIALEPQKDTYNMLKLNIRLNTITNITTLNCAVFSKVDKVHLYSNYSVMPDRAQGEKKFVEVNADTLDNILQNIGISHSSINWIKIDVEGAELEVLKGAHKVLSESPQLNILIEIHGKDKYLQIINLLPTYGFTIDFEKSYGWGDKHVLLHKNTHTDKI